MVTLGPNMRARYAQATQTITTANSPPNSKRTSVRNQASLSAAAALGQCVTSFRVSNTRGTWIAEATPLPATMNPPSAASGMTIAAASSSGNAPRYAGDSRSQKWMPMQACTHTMTSSRLCVIALAGHSRASS